nr:WRC protein [Ipomoea batatas]
MRIRKRFPQPSDPQLNLSVMALQRRQLARESPIIQPPPPSAAATACCSPPSPPPDPPNPPPDHPAPTRIPNPISVFSGCDSFERKMEQKGLEAVKEEEEDDERITTGGNDSKKDGISTALQDSFISLPFSSSHQDGRWCGGEREVPLKKRRGNGFEKYVVGKETTNKPPKMKSKTNKKCVQESGDHGAAAAACGGGGDNNGRYDAVKKSKRGSEIVEGSRCSRVNGRGWRCCQQTLVGYSLCEHHLGKGRLRSVNAVKNRQMGESTNAKTKPHNAEESAETSWDSSKEKPLLLLENSDDDDDDNNEREKPSSGAKKRVKLGMVKARSISSLLGQTDNLVATKAAENEGEMRVN